LRTQMMTPAISAQTMKVSSTGGERRVSMNVGEESGMFPPQASQWVRESLVTGRLFVR